MQIYFVWQHSIVKQLMSYPDVPVKHSCMVNHSCYSPSSLTSVCILFVSICYTHFIQENILDVLMYIFRNNNISAIMLCSFLRHYGFISPLEIFQLWKWNTQCFIVVRMQVNNWKQQKITWFFCWKISKFSDNSGQKLLRIFYWLRQLVISFLFQQKRREKLTKNTPLPH